MSLVGLAALGGIWLFAAENPRASLPEASGVKGLPVAAHDPDTLVLVAASANPQTSLEPEAKGEVAAATQPIPEVDKMRPAVSHHPRDRLAEEVSIIARAQAALNGDKPAVALEILSEHERKFGNGLLVEERIAARAQALRAQGRGVEADAQLMRLSPNSIHGRTSR